MRRKLHLLALHYSPACEAEGFVEASEESLTGQLDATEPGRCPWPSLESWKPWLSPPKNLYVLCRFSLQPIL